MPDRPPPSGEDWDNPPSSVPGWVQPPTPGGPANTGAPSGWGSQPAWDTPAAPPSAAASGWSNAAPPPSGAVPGPPSNSFAPQSAGASNWGAQPGGTAVVAGGGQLGPPVWILLIGLVLPLLAITGLFVNGLGIHIAGWLVAIFGSVGALAVFTAIDLRRRTSRWYVDQPGLLAALRVAVLVVGLIVAGFFAYQIADEVSRWDW